MHTLKRALTLDDEREPDSPERLLVVANVSHEYVMGHEILPVLSEVSVTVARSRFAAVIGPSGSGKSTLLGLIAGLERPTGGTIQVEGLSKRLGRVGYMPQRDLLHPWLDALGNASVGLEVRGAPRAEAQAAAAALLLQFGLGGFEHARPNELSGGMRQRVALARTILAAGNLVLLDEPFGALDALTRLHMQRWLMDTWPSLGRTGLMVTHDVDEALLLADDVFVLSARPGRLIAHVRVPFERPRSPVLQGLQAFASLKLRLLSHLGATEESN
ncbi:MAG: ATP-binding cassette domain-containing protein [Chloroflexi bacterium]|nr:ATP-binding cassette domain-containing protein [Chloroflexota bacterium]